MSKNRTKYNPGPGSYNANKNQFFTNIMEVDLANNRKGVTFTSVKRFPVDKNSIIGPGTYQINRDLKPKNGIAVSKEKRTLFNMK